MDVTTANFDYSTIEDKDVKGKLINIEGRIKKRWAGVVSSIIETGGDLSAARSVLADHKNGTFVRWLEDACGFSERTAYNYMNAFDRFGSFATVAKLEDTAMYALAAPSTPEKAVAEAKKLADKGVQVTAKLAKELIAKHQPKSDPSKPTPTSSNGSAKHDEPPKTQTVAQQIATAEDADDEEIKELSVQEKCEADNKDIESFCRDLTKFFDDKLPGVVWIDSQGRVGSARSSLKACCNTLRQSKSTLCPKCDEGQTKKGDCTYCKGYGYLPKLMADALGGEK